MSMPTDENPHTERFPTHELVWWSNGAASGRSGADHVEMFQYLEGVGRYTIGTFNYPEEVRDLERLQEALARAFDLGRKDKARELRAVLEIQL